LHFEVTTAYKPFIGEGIPYVIDKYTVTLPNGGLPVSSIEVSNSDQGGKGKHLVTSFSSKSELALHLSPDGNVLTFMATSRLPMYSTYQSQRRPF
jgi:hypothetical protein